MILRSRKIPWRCRVSVVVPCAARHASLLPGLIAALERQTSRPDEVVISISGVAASPKMSSRTFPLLCASTSGPANAARNRNVGSARASGDVLLYQDADDLPHPQRVEIIRTIFGRLEIDHLMHGFVYENSLSGGFTRRHDVNNLHDRVRGRRAYAFELGLTNGNPAVSKKLATAVRWPEERSVGEDVAFNQAACARSGRSGVLSVPLLLYRHRLSAGRGP